MVGGATVEPWDSLRANQSCEDGLFRNEQRDTRPGIDSVEPNTKSD